MMKPNKASTRAMQAALLQGWQREKAALVKSFTFADFQETMRFVNRVATLAESTDHHPQMQVGYRTCALLYTTHEIGCISEKDLDAIAKIEAWEAG